MAECLSRLLVEEGSFECHHWLGFAGGMWRQHYRKLHGGSILRFTQRAMSWFSLQAGFPDFFTPEIFIHNALRKSDYSLYHFHDISRAFSPIALRWLSKRKPVILTLHDCTAFTGGCLYPMDCTAFHSLCGNCPQLHLWPLKTHIDRTGWMYEFKKATARAGLFIPIAPSNWMADEAVKSGMFQERPRVIPYCVDTDVFQPRPHAVIRSELGLPDDRFIVLLNVHKFEDERKGVQDAIEVLRNGSCKPLVIALGAVGHTSRRLFDGIDVRFLGFIKDRSIVAQYCAAADVLLYPTHADNLPNAVLESLASGTPTIGYDTGGMPDTIEHGVNGWLAPTGNRAALAQGLEIASSDLEQCEKWAINCREKALTKFSKKNFIEAHIALYQGILDTNSILLPHLVNR